MSIQEIEQRIFGPVPSRRLGMSLGINNIPPKNCTYSCMYCQIGYSISVSTRRKVFYDPKDLIAEVSRALLAASLSHTAIDYLTIVPDGESTLDIQLADLILGLKQFGIPVAIIQNSSLMNLPEVRDALLLADWVSCKVDTVDETVWHRIDHPYRLLDLSEILSGIQAFAASFHGRLVTETMVVGGVNDTPELADQTARFITSLSPATSYLSIPTRPPADRRVIPPTEENLTRVYDAFIRHLPSVEVLAGYEGNQFVSLGDLSADILRITAVHPMRHDAMEHLVQSRLASMSVVDELVSIGLLKKVSFSGYDFYARVFVRNNSKGDS